MPEPESSAGSLFQTVPFEVRFFLLSLLESGSTHASLPARDRFPSGWPENAKVYESFWPHATCLSVWSGSPSRFCFLFVTVLIHSLHFACFVNAIVTFPPL